MGSSCLTANVLATQFWVGMYCSSYSSYGGGYGGTSCYGGTSAYLPHYGGDIRTTPARGFSLPPSGLAERALRQRTVFRRSAREESLTTPENRNLRLKSPSIPRERTRDE